MKEVHKEYERANWKIDASQLHTLAVPLIRGPIKLPEYPESVPTYPMLAPVVNASKQNLTQPHSINTADSSSQRTGRYKTSMIDSSPTNSQVDEDEWIYPMDDLSYNEVKDHCILIHNSIKRESLSGLPPKRTRRTKRTKTTG